MKIDERSRYRCRYFHPYQGEPAGHGTADRRPNPPWNTYRKLKPVYDRYKASKDK